MSSYIRVVGGLVICAGSALVALPASAQSSGSQWSAVISGFSQHARETLAPGRQWNEFNQGVGLQRRVPGVPWDRSVDRSEWSTRYTFGTLQDSRGFDGSYGSVLVMRELARVSSVRIEGGANMGLWYRSKSWSGAMHVVPAVLPTLSLTEHRTGFGMDLTWVPPVRYGNQEAVSTVLLQFKYRVEY